MDLDAQVSKFRGCAAALGDRRVEAIAEAVLQLSSLARAAELSTLLDQAT
jgi:hypothetical protein